MASNIIAPQPIPQNLSLAEDIWKMWQSAAPFPQELAEKEGSLKRALPQAFVAQMEPPVKRAPPPTQFAPQIPQQMQNNLAAQQQQFLQQQQAALQQALARGQLPANFAAIPISQAAMNGVPQIQLQNPQLLAHLEKLQKEQQQMQQQQMQQQQQLQQQQLQQQQQQQMQQQMHQQQQLHQLMHQKAMQNGGLPGLPGQMPPVSAQMLQGQVVRAGPPHMMNLQQAEQYAQLLKLNPQLMMNPQQAQQVQQQQAQLLQAHSAPAGPQQNILVPQMPGRRQTIGPATVTPQMMGVIPRMHHPSPKLIPTSSPLHMLPSSSSVTPVAKSPFAAPAILPVRPPTAPTLIPTAKLTPPTTMNTQNPAIIPAGFLKGPDEPNYINFLNHCRVIEQQIHSMLGDGMVRMPPTTKEST